MKLSDGEKLILVMLCELYKKLGIESTEMNPELVQAAITSGNLWGLRSKYGGTLYATAEISEETVREVSDILDMWRVLENGFKELPNQDQSRVEKEGSGVRFAGIYGNGESQYTSVAALW